MADRLLDVRPLDREQYQTGRDLIHVPLLACPRCDSPVEVGSLYQDSLVRHGGYGGSQRVETVGCTSCTWEKVVAVSTERPPR